MYFSCSFAWQNTRDVFRPLKKTKLSLHRNDGRVCLRANLFKLMRYGNEPMVACIITSSCVRQYKRLTIIRRLTVTFTNVSWGLCKDTKILLSYISVL